MPDALQNSCKISDWIESDMPFPKVSTGQNFSLYFVPFPKKQALTYTDFSPRANQTFPFIWFL